MSEQTGFPAIKQALDERAAAFDEFKKANEAERTALRERVEELETRSKSPGRTGAEKVDGASEAKFVDAETGKPLCVLGKGIETKGAMRRAGLLKDDDEPVTLSDFFRAVSGMRTRNPLATKALSEGTDSAGGYTVPAHTMARFIEALVPQSSLLNAGAQIVMLTDPAKTYTMARIDTLPTAAWRSEAGAVAESDPVFGAVTFTPRSLSFYFKVSRELLADSVNADAALLSAITSAFAKALDAAALMGSGTPPTPRGLYNVVGVQPVTNGAAGALLSAIKWGNLISGWSAIRAANGPVPTAAIMAPRTLTGFAGLADSTGQPMQRPQLLEGMPFFDTSAIPIDQTVTSSTDCSTLFLGDFTRSMFGIREQMSILRANELFALNGQVGFVCHLRCDFAVEYPAAFAVVTGIRPG